MGGKLRGSEQRRWRSVRTCVKAHFRVRRSRKVNAGWGESYDIFSNLGFELCGFGDYLYCLKRKKKSRVCNIKELALSMKFTPAGN